MNSVEGSVCIDAGVPNHPQKVSQYTVFWMCFSLAWLLGQISPCAFECVCVCVCVWCVCMLIAKLFWIKPRAIKTRGILQRKPNATHREFPELGIGAVLTNQNDVKRTLLVKMQSLESSLCAPAMVTKLKGVLSSFIDGAFVSKT